MKLSSEFLQKNALPQVFERGKAVYAQSGSIPKLIKRGDIYEAEVKGSGIVPYKTAIDLGSARMKASCNCPYEQKGYCKHIVAVGLAIIDGAFIEGKADSPPELRLSFENILNIRKQIKSARDADSQRIQMKLRLQQEQYIDALKITLAIYESRDGAFRNVWQKAEKELTEAFEPLSLSMPFAKEMITLIFDRWRKYAGSFQKKEDGFTFALEDWGRTLLALAKDDVPRRFLQIRLQGFGLTEDFLKK